MDYEEIKNTLQLNLDLMEDKYKQCNSKDWRSLFIMLDQQNQINKDLSETIIEIADQLDVNTKQIKSLIDEFNSQRLNSWD